MKQFGVRVLVGINIDEIKENKPTQRKKNVFVACDIHAVIAADAIVTCLSSYHVMWLNSEVSSPALLGLTNLVSFPSPKILKHKLPPAASPKKLYPSRDIGTTRSRTREKNKSRSL